MGLALIKGVGLGAGLMYFFDPDLGRRRRALVADQFTHGGHALGDFLGASTRDLGNRARGMTAELTRRFRDEPTPDDGTLVQRVRAILGHHASHPRAIEVAARGGHVLLRGPIPEHELEGLMAAVAGVPGVLDVADELVIRRGQGHPAPEGETSRTGLSPGSWSPATRLLAGAAGVAVAMPLVRRSPLAALTLGGLGLMLVARNQEGGGRGANRSPDRGGRGAGATGSSGSGIESGWPGGRGRIDVTGRSGVYSASGPLPPGDAELRTPAEFVRGQLDDQGRPVEGGSEITNRGGALASDRPSAPGDRAAPGNT